MIHNKGKINVTQGIEYISDWKDVNGSYLIEQYISKGRNIVNKKLTGTGFTSYCLISSSDVILVSPRIRLIQNKLSQFPNCFYFNREKDKKTGKSKKGIDQLEVELISYCQQCSTNHLPFKLLVTYDSFGKLCDMLEQKFKINISSKFLICVDESHSLIKDVKLKEYANKSILSNFVGRLFLYDHLLFISATPIVNYVQEIQEFKTHDVDYYELEWSNADKVSSRVYGCRSALDAFDQIYKQYDSHTDSNGMHVFDAIFGENGFACYSYEAVIFLNSILDTTKILKKYIMKLGLIDVKDVSIICADTKENQDALHAINKRLNILTDLPLKNEKHCRWSFVTRTAFEGCDFYHPSSSQFVIANYNVDSLCLDISTDLVQIVGRSRLKSNPFRNIIHIFYTGNKRVIDDNEFNKMQKMKLDNSLKRISIWNTADQDCKAIALEDLAEKIKRKPNDLYLSTTSGKPEINQLLQVSEQYCRDILKNYTNWFVQLARNTQYSMHTQQLREVLFLECSSSITQARVRITLDYFQNYPGEKDEFFLMLCQEGYTEIARYFSTLPLNRIKALGCNTTLMDAEINVLAKSSNIATVVAGKFTPGQTYSKDVVKKELQNVYDSLGLRKKAKATDLPNYIKCHVVKRGGKRVFLIG